MPNSCEGDTRGSVYLQAAEDEPELMAYFGWVPHNGRLDLAALRGIRDAIEAGEAPGLLHAIDEVLSAVDAEVPA